MNEVDREARADWLAARHDLEQDVPEPDEVIDTADELLYVAWGIIANAHGGRWDEADPVWKTAAINWRDRWHARLDATKGTDDPFA